MPPVWEAMLRYVGGGTLGVIRGVMRGGGGVWLYGCMYSSTACGGERGRGEREREKEGEGGVHIQLITG